MMTVHPDQADPEYNHSRMNCRVFFQLPLDVYSIDASIYNQVLKTLHIFLVHLVSFNNGINPDIGTLKKERGDILS